jgi:hypothetical protein
MFGHRSFLMLGGDSPADIKSLVSGGYELLNCKFEMNQGVKPNGRVNTRVYAGSLDIVMAQFPPKDIVEWGIESRVYKDGMIVILDADNVPVEKIIFQHAACIRMELDYIRTGRSYASVKLSIQPEKLVFGSNSDITFTNEWI